MLTEEGKEMDSAMDMLAQTEASMNAEKTAEGTEAAPAPAEGEKEPEEPKEVIPSTVEPEIPVVKHYRLFVGQIPKDTTRDEFEEFFKALGAECDFLKEGTERPFGFINVSDEESRDRILNQEVEFKETKLSISLAKSKSVKFFVGGITDEINETMLTDHFNKFGDVKEAFIVNNRGFAFVVLESQQIKVLNQIPKSQHTINGKQVDVKTAHPKREQGGFGGRGGWGGGYPGGFPPYGGYHPYGGHPYGGGYGGYGRGY